MDTKLILDYMAEKGLGVIGKTLFRDKMPSSGKVPRGVLVTNQTMTQTDPDVSRMVRGLFEITAREPTFDEARATMNNVSSVMSSRQRLVIGDVLFLYIRPYNTPLVYPVSDGSIVEASVLFEFKLILP